QMGGGPLAEGGEAVGGGGVRPAALVGQPARGREVVERHDRVDPGLEERLALPGVVVERRRAVLAVLRLDAAPLDREAVVGEPEVSDDRHVLPPAVPAVAGVAARLAAPGAGRVLPAPPVVVPAATLDLVGRGGGPPP